MLHIGPVLVDPPVLQAPMAGFTNYAYRQVVREFGGAGLQATEMICAQGFLGRERYEGELPDRLWGVAEEPRPLAVQIWDNDPGRLAAVGAKLAHELNVSVVDINFGCPVRDVAERAHSGSYLLERTAADRRDRRARRRGVRSDARYRENPPRLHARLDPRHRSGASGRIGRRRCADGSRPHGSGFFQGPGRLGPHRRNQAAPEAHPADRQRRPQLRRKKCSRHSRRYGVDGVMIARAALGKPWLFRQVQAAMRGEEIPPDPTLEEERLLLVRHYELVCRRFGVEKGTSLMRKFACCYAQGRRGARDFRAAVARVCTPEEFLAAVEDHFPRDRFALSAM